MTNFNSKGMLLVVAIVLVLAVAISGCRFGRMTGRSNFSVQGKTSTFSKHFDLDMRKDVPVRLELDFKLKRGTISWSLVDPLGEEQWSEEITAEANYKKSRTIESIEGTWSLDVECTEVEGDFYVRWNGFSMRRNK